MNKFTLKRVLTVKERLRDVRRSELAVASQEVEQAENRASQAAQERKRAIEAVTKLGEISARDLEGRYAIAAMAKRDEHGARTDLNARVEERTRRGAILQEVDREVRMFDALRQRAVRLDERAQQAREQTESDESASRPRSDR
jgi:flagellar export protein FliJ